MSRLNSFSTINKRISEFESKTIYQSSLIPPINLLKRRFPINPSTLNRDPWTNRFISFRFNLGKHLRTKGRWKRGVKLEIERNSNHRRRDGRFGYVVRSTHVYLYSNRHPKLVGSRADTARSKVDGLGSKVVYLA